MSTYAMQTDASPKTAQRLVWILNRDVEPYVAEYQGLKVTIPPSGEKIAKHARDGGNLMPYLDARHFITDLKQPQKWVMDPRGGSPQPVFGIKALYSHELTEDEFNKIVGKTKTEVKKEAILEEKRVRKSLTKALNERSNKVKLEDDED